MAVQEQGPVLTSEEWEFLLRINPEEALEAADQGMVDRSRIKNSKGIEYRVFVAKLVQIGAKLLAGKR